MAKQSDETYSYGRDVEGEEEEYEVSSSSCEYCGCNGNCGDKEFLQTIQTSITEKMDHQHRENVMMFSRIMDKLNKNSGNAYPTSTSQFSDFSLIDFPCCTLEKLAQINTYCSHSAAAMDFLETKLKTVYTKDHKDIVRNMLKALAPDEVWANVSLQETTAKKSFVKDFAAIKLAIERVCAETYPEACTANYCHSRFMVFFHHTTERIQRKQTK